MAANDEFPRGWNISQFAAGGPITLTMAAVPGVIHVLTDMAAFLQAGAAEGPFTVTVTSSLGTLTTTVIGGGYQFSGGQFDTTASNLKLQTLPNEALTVSWNPGAINCFLRIQGYDI